MINQPVLLVAISIIAALAAHNAFAEIEISSDQTQNMSCSAGVCRPTGHNPVLNVSDLTAMLASTDVIVATKQGRHAGGIKVVAPLSWASSHKLTFQGTNVYSSPIRIASAVVVTGQGSVVVIGQLNIDPGASITFWDAGSTLTVGFTTYQLVSDLPSLASDIAANPGGAFALMNDYDAQSDTFRKSPIPLLQGQLAGLGHTISNVTVPRGVQLCEGLVATTTELASISDFSFHNIKVLSDGKSRNVGGVVGCNSGGISNVTVDGLVGGVSNANVGGIAGENTGNRGSVFRSHSNVSVLGGQAGGLVGENDNQVQASSASGTVTGSINAGGLVGSNNSTVYGSYAAGLVNGPNNVGGLVGSNHGDVTNSYSSGSVSGGTGATGGLIGFNAGSATTSYSTGVVSGGQYVGGLVGSDPNETISLAYWDLDTSGISNPSQGGGNPANDPGIEGVTSAQLTSKLPYGFDKRVWRQSAEVNGGFPYLRYNQPQ